MRRFVLAVIIISVVLLLIKRRNMTWHQSLMKTFYPLIMLRGKLFDNGKNVWENKEQVKPLISFYSLQATLNNGTVIDFSRFKGKKVLLVNTASDCGFTGQYDELERLAEQYSDQLVVVGFPANDFKQQEKKDDAAIAAFCKINYGVTFQLAKKSHVLKGTDQHPVFQWLSDAGRNGWCKQEPVWNFCKYLVNEEGLLIAFFPQTVSPLHKRVVNLIR
jgi:glutathione peroxidase